jgi:hypothetical protein
MSIYTHPNYVRIGSSNVNADLAAGPTALETAIELAKQAIKYKDFQKFGTEIEADTERERATMYIAATLVGLKIKGDPQIDPYRLRALKAELRDEIEAYKAREELKNNPVVEAPSPQKQEQTQKTSLADKAPDKEAVKDAKPQAKQEPVTIAPTVTKEQPAPQGFTQTYPYKTLEMAYSAPPTISVSSYDGAPAPALVRKGDKVFLPATMPQNTAPAKSISAAPQSGQGLKDRFNAAVLSQDIKATLEELNINEDLYLTVRQDIVRSQDARRNTLKEIYNFTGSDISKIVMALDIEGITSKPDKPFTARSVNYHPDGALKL